MSRKNRAVVFVTDKGFIVPTLVAACQLARQGASALADTIIYLLDVDIQTIAKLEDVFREKGITFIPIETRSFMPSNDMHFRQNHVSVATLARLVLSDYIPAQYEHVIYLDGDIQIASNISAFLNYDVPPGMIAAGNGSMWLRFENGNLPYETQEYLSGLGGIQPYDYFNAGIMAFRRDTWAEIGPLALKYFFENSSKCYHHDQSALNAVCKGRRVALSPSYNFHSDYARLFVQGYCQPKIIHFTGKAKPWRHACMLWGVRYSQPYDEILGNYSLLSEFQNKPNLKALKTLWEGTKVGIRTVEHGPQILAQRSRFHKYVTSTTFAF